MKKILTAIIILVTMLTGCDSKEAVDTNKKNIPYGYGNPDPKYAVPANPPAPYSQPIPVIPGGSSTQKPQKCNFCYGTGTCDFCKGLGCVRAPGVDEAGIDKAYCTACRGGKKCHKCNGSGKLSY